MKIGIIGCGNMGEAILRGMITKDFAHKINILISDKDRRKTNSAYLRFRVGVAASNSELFKKCKVIILAVKPQDVDTVLQDIDSSMKGKLLISICAGVKTKRLEASLGRVSIVRVMPNIPARIAQGISAVCLGRYASARDKKFTESLFSCIGEVIEIDEKLMNAVTAVSGSGPAYFFYLMEKLIESAKKMGVPEHIAKRLTLKTAMGSAMLMDQSKEKPQILRKQVSSKGGTTEAAFNVFGKKGLDRILVLAFKAAAKRARELEK